MPNAIELLRADHEEVSALFQEAAAATDSKKKIVDKFCSSLTIHATIEEEIFRLLANKASDSRNA
jgi:hypothetical protein